MSNHVGIDSSTFISEDNFRCRVCHGGDEEEVLIKPCRCRGSIKYVHKSCLFTWIGDAENPLCEICNYPYKFKKVYCESKPSNFNIVIYLLYLKDLMIDKLKFLIISVAFILKIFLMVYINLKAVNDNDPRIVLFISIMLIYYNYFSYTVTCMIRSVIKNAIFSRMHLNLSARNNYLLDSSQPSEDDIDNYIINYSSSSLLNDLNHMIFNIEDISKFINEPFSLYLNIIGFASTTFLALLINIFSIVTFPLNIILQVFSHLWKNFHLKSSGTFYVVKLFQEFLLYLDVMKLKSTLVQLINFIIVYLVVLGISYIVKIRTKDFNIKEIYFYLKGHFILTVFRMTIYMLQGVLVFFLLLNVNDTDPKDFYVINKCKSLSILFHIALGFFMNFVLNEYYVKFQQISRPGILMFDMESDETRSSLIIKYIIQTSFIRQIIRGLFSFVSTIFIFVFVLSHFSIYAFSTYSEKYFVLICTISIIKNISGLDKFLFRIIKFIYRQCSYLLSLDNYLYGTKMMNIEFSRLFWRSNKNDIIEHIVTRANKQRRIEIDGSTMIEDFYNHVCRKDIKESFSSTNNTTIGVSNDETETLENSSHRNHTNVSSQISSHTSLYTIDNIKFMRLFGKKHSKLIGIFYVPKFLALRILFIDVLCILSIKLFFVLFYFLISMIISLFFSVFKSSFISQQNLYYLLISFTFNCFKIDRNWYTQLILNLYTFVFSPLFSTVIIYCCTSSPTPFISLFYYNSIFTVIISSTFLAITNLETLSITNIIGILFSSTVLFNVTSVALFNHTWMNISYIIRIAVFFFVLRKLIINTIDFLNGNVYSEIMEKYYLKEKILLDYSEETS